MLLHTKLLLATLVVALLPLANCNVIRIARPGEPIFFRDTQPRSRLQESTISSSSFFDNPFRGFVSAPKSGSHIAPYASSARVFPFAERVDGRNIVSWFQPRIAIPQVECHAANGALDIGTCYSESQCSGLGGVASGGCLQGGVCCIFPTVCGGQASQNRTWFVNKDFPDYSTDSGECELTIRRKDDKVKQVRLDFRFNELGDALQGECLMDLMTVRRTGSRENLMPPLCGNNNGQHVYVNFGYQDLKLEIKMRGKQRRKWHILVSQVNNEQEVDDGCLQFYTDKATTIKSLNYNSGSYLFKGNLDYDICFPKTYSWKTDADRCERKAEDLDLRQSENDIRTKKEAVPESRTVPKKGKARSTSRRGWKPAAGAGKRRRRGGRQLNVMMAYGDDGTVKSSPLRFLADESARKYSPQAAYTLITDPVYNSRLNKVKAQLTSSGSSGLENLLNSKSKLDEMRDEFGLSTGDDDDVYYYYYYDDDVLKNEVRTSDNPEQVTDNYAVEHNQKEFVVLPDGSPVPASFFSQRPTANIIETTHNPKQFLTTKKKAQEYFHTGMIQDLLEKNEQKNEVKYETQYPIPTYFERPTTPQSVHEKARPYSGASIYVFDPMSDLKEKESAFTRLSTEPVTVTSTKERPTTRINQDDDIVLKHNGMQWTLLKEKETETADAADFFNVSPHNDVTTITPVPTQPHLVFKHPSGKVTEMLVEDSKDGNPDEKIVTVIETGELTQNLTKFRIDDISELDRVIEAVFNVIDNKDLKPVAQTPSPNTAQPTTTPAQTSPVNSYASLSTEGHPTLKNQYIVVSSPNDMVETEAPTTYSARPEFQTAPPRLVQRFTGTSTEASPTIVYTTKAKPMKGEAVVNTNVQNIVSVFNQDAPVQIEPEVEDVSTVQSPTFTTLEQFLSRQSENKHNINTIVIEEIPESTPSATVKPVTNNPFMYSTPTEDPFTTMLNNLRGLGTDKPESEEKVTPIFYSPQQPTQQPQISTPKFKISSTKDGIVATKTYATIEEALNDIQTKATPSFDKFVTVPMDFTHQPTQVPIITETSSFNLQPVEQGKVPETAEKEEEEEEEEEEQEPFVVNENSCGESFLQVDGVRICNNLLRTESIRGKVNDLFRNMDRISVRSVGNSDDSLRFSLTYDTVCASDESSPRTVAPITRRVSTTTTTEPVETIGLMQYLMGWY